jgi:2-(1,2-epoxy-1,2-dihydrophenyl)acetyl-CoA isomerase
MALCDRLALTVRLFTDAHLRRGTTRVCELIVGSRGRTRWVRLNRPHRLNAFTWEVRDQIIDALTLGPDDDVDAIVVTGTGRAFSAGIDLGVLQDEADVSPARRRVDLERAQRIAQLMSDASCPVIAAVNGVAAGGGWALALAADVVVAVESARFVTAFVQLGLVPDLGFGYNLTRRVGSMQAKSIIMRGLRLDAREAFALGAVDKIVADGELEASVEALLPGIVAAGKPARPAIPSRPAA